MSRRETFTASGFGPPAKPKGDHLTPEERAEVQRRIAEGKVTRVDRGVQALADMDYSIEAQRERGRRIAQRDMKFRRLRQSAEAIEAASVAPGPSAAAIERTRKTADEIAPPRRPAGTGGAGQTRGGNGHDRQAGLRGGRAADADLSRHGHAAADMASARPAHADVVEQESDAARLGEQPGQAGAPEQADASLTLVKLGIARVEPARLTPLPTWREACAFELVPVARLYVRPAYQRAMSSKAMRRVRRIAEAFDWAKFGVIVVARAGEGFEVIDGQTRATAARSRLVREVPALVVSAEAAAVFLGLNRDRANLDTAQLFHAELAAGPAGGRSSAPT